MYVLAFVLRFFEKIKKFNSFITSTYFLIIPIQFLKSELPFPFQFLELDLELGLIPDQFRN